MPLLDSKPMTATRRKKAPATVDRDAFRPTRALPGTPEKAGVFAARRAAKAPLFHPLDARVDEMARDDWDSILRAFGGR